jgi:DNA-binding MarR family transcriptional regulator
VRDDTKARLVQELAQVLTQIKRIGWSPETDQKVRRSEFRALGALAFSGESGMKMSDLSTQMHITPAAATHMINSLEEGGYIERMADPADRRVVLVRLTDEGKHTLQVLKAQLLDTLSGLVAFLGEQDSRELVRLLSATLTYFRDKRV